MYLRRVSENLRAYVVAVKRNDRWAVVTVPGSHITPSPNSEWLETTKNWWWWWCTVVVAYGSAALTSRRIAWMRSFSLEGTIMWRAQTLIIVSSAERSPWARHNGNWSSMVTRMPMAMPSKELATVSQTKRVQSTAEEERSGRGGQG